MRKTVAYLRVSTDAQAESGFGLDIQRERISAYACAYGWTIDEWFVDDGFSGSSTDRPALTSMMSNLENIGRVIVLRLDRLTRSIIDGPRLIRTMKEIGISFCSVMENLDTDTASGNLLVNLLTSFAEYERQTITDRTTSGRIARAKSGERGCGKVPYGYRSVDGRTIVHDEEAKVVKFIVESVGIGGRRGRNRGLSKIAEQLNEAGIPSPSGKSWTHATVSYISSNPIYRGFVRYGDSVESRNSDFVIV